MSKIIALLTNEHASAHVLSLKKKYSTPNIYDANGDLSKRWYVYYSFRNPETDKLERQTHIYAGVNKFKTLRERKNAIKILAQAVENILESGYNPYEDEEIVSTSEEKKYTIEDAITFSLELKKNTLKENSFRDYRVRIKSFEKWLYANGFENRTINSVDKKTIVTFLNSVLSTTSAKNRNNTRAILSMFFQSLEDNDIIPDNFVKKINVLKSNPERNKTYSSKQEVDIFNYLKSNDELMLLFIQFISYNHLRPVEVVRLQIKDVNVKDRRLYVRAKNKAVKVKIIPEILLSTLPNLDKFNPESYLFTPNGIGQPKPLHETILELFYFESKEKPCKLTKNEVFWKFKDPSVSEFQIEEVLNWLVHHKKLNENLGYYTLDKYEAIELEERIKKERETIRKETDSIFYANSYSIKKPKILEIFVHYIAPTLLISYTFFILFLISKLNTSFELSVGKSENINEVSIAEPKSGYIGKKKALSDKEVKYLFKNQQQNIVYLNKTIDTLQKQVTKINEIHSKSTNVIHQQIKTIHNQVHAILFHLSILLVGFILLFFLKNIL